MQCVQVGWRKKVEMEYGNIRFKLDSYVDLFDGSKKKRKDFGKVIF